MFELFVLQEAINKNAKKNFLHFKVDFGNINILVHIFNALTI